MGALVEVNTDGLAKLADTVGGWPGLNARAIELNAEAEAFAVVRRVDAENAATLARLEGEERVANYILAREKRKMENAKSVAQLAQSQMVEGEAVSSEPVNPDWLNRFFSIVEEVSDAQMQRLWAQILAGEVKQPKSYSLRTLETLRNMTKEEADTFVKATTYILDGDSIITEPGFSLSVEEQLLLSDIGLVNNEVLTVTYTMQAQEEPSFIAVDRDFGVGIYNPDIPVIRLEFSVKSLTKAGKELVKLIDYTASDVVYNCVVAKSKQQRCKAVIKSPIVEHLPSGHCTYSKKGVILYQQDEK